MSTHPISLRNFLAKLEILIERLNDEPVSPEQKSKLSFNLAFIHDLRKMELQYPAMVSGRNLVCSNDPQKQCSGQNGYMLSADDFLDAYQNDYITQSKEIASLAQDKLGVPAAKIAHILQSYVQKLAKKSDYILFSPLDTPEPIDPLYSDQLLGYLGTVKNTDKPFVKSLASAIERYINATPIELGVDEQGNVTIQNPPVNNLRREANKRVARLKNQLEQNEDLFDPLKQAPSHQENDFSKDQVEISREIIQIDKNAAFACRAANTLKEVTPNDLHELFEEANKRCPAMPESQRQVCESIITAICNLEHRRAEGMGR